MEWIELGKLANIETGKLNANAADEDGKYPFFTCADEISRINDYKYDKECILIAGNGNLNVKYYSGKFNAYQRTYIVESKDKKTLSTMYLYYFMNTYMDKLRELSIGGVIKYIKLGHLQDAKIPVPPMEIQENIVKVLDQAQALIDKRKEQIEALDQLIESIFYTMFGDPVRNEKGWKIERLKDITSKIGSGSTPRGGESSYKKSGISLIRSMNVYDNKFKYDGLAYIDEEQAKLLSNVIVGNNDILINITGASITRTTIVPKNILPARVNQHVSILRCNNQVAHIYLLHLLISKKYKQKIYYISTSSGATREALTKVNLENLEIPIPPIPLQNEFAQKVEVIEKQKELLEESLKLLEENYKSIMDKAFKGQLFN